VDVCLRSDADVDDGLRRDLRVRDAVHLQREGQEGTSADQHQVCFGERVLLDVVDELELVLREDLAQSLCLSSSPMFA
jgi:hypothetical protein